MRRSQSVVKEMAPTGVAAQNLFIGAETIHSGLSIQINTFADISDNVTGL